MATTAEGTHRHGIWTDDYSFRHCEGYCVRGPQGTVGFVEEVWLSPQGDTVKALVVRLREANETVTVGPEFVDEIDTGGECLRISGLD